MNVHKLGTFCYFDEFVVVVVLSEVLVKLEGSKSHSYDGFCSKSCLQTTSFLCHLSQGIYSFFLILCVADNSSVHHNLQESFSFKKGTDPFIVSSFPMYHSKQQFQLIAEKERLSSNFYIPNKPGVFLLLFLADTY